MALEAAEVVLRVPGAVAHGVGVFAQDVGLAHLVFLEIAVDLLDGGIHAAVQVQVVLVDVLALRREGGPLVVGQPGGIVALGPAQGLVEIAAHAGFVAHGPDQYAGPVFIANDAVLHAVQYGLAVFGVLGQQVVAVIGIVGAVLEHHAVALHVGLGNQVEAVFVAHAGKQRRIGIVAGPNGVDVVMLHQNQVAQHLLLPHGAAQNGVGVVAVDALELDGLAVELYHAVFHANVPKADGLAERLAVVAQNQSVQIGILRAPEGDVVQVDFKAVAVGPAVVDAVSSGIVQVIVGMMAGSRVLSAVFQLHANPRAGAVRRQLGVNEVIPQVATLPAQDVHIPEDAAHAEFVLILKIAAVAPLQHQHVDPVLTRVDEFGDLKLAGGMGNLAVAHEGSVDPQIETGIHALEHDGPLAVVLGDIEIAPVEPAGVVVGHVGRIIREGIAPVGVLVPVVAVHLPHGGHGNAVHLHAGIQGIAWQIDDAFEIPELPAAVEGLEAIGLLPLVPQGDVAVGIGHVVGPVGQRIHMQRVGIHMILGQVHGSISFVKSLRPAPDSSRRVQCIPLHSG